METSVASPPIEEVTIQFVPVHMRVALSPVSVSEIVAQSPSVSAGVTALASSPETFDNVNNLTSNRAVSQCERTRLCACHQILTERRVKSNRCSSNRLRNCRSRDVRTKEGAECHFLVDGVPLETINNVKQVSYVRRSTKLCQCCNFLISHLLSPKPPA